MKNMQDNLSNIEFGGMSLAQLKQDIAKNFSSFRNVMILAIDPSLHLLLYNKTFQEKILEVSHIEINQQLMLDDIFVHESDYHTAVSCFSLALKGKTFSNFQKFEFEEKRYYEAFYSPLQDHQGGIYGAILFIRDITDKKLDEVDVLNAEEQLKRMANVLHLGLALEEVVYNDEGDPIDCKFRFINHQYKKITGLKEDLVIGKPVSQIIPDAQDGTFWLDKYKNAITTGETISFDHYAPYIKKWFNIVAYCPIPHRLALLLTDISERKNAEEKIKQSEHLYRTTVNSLIAGVIVYNKHGEVISMNKEAEKILGLSATQCHSIQDTILLTIFDENERFLFPHETTLTDIFVSKKAVVNQTYGFKHLQTNQNIWINLSIIPVLDSTGDLERVITNFIDITDRKRMEDRILEDKQALFIEKKQAEETLLAIAEGVISTDANGIIKNFNHIAEVITEWERKDAIGQSFDQVFHIVDQDNQTVQSPIEIILKDRKAIQNKEKYLLKSNNGQNFHIECSSAPIINTEDVLIGVVIIFRNITDDLNLARHILMERQRLQRVVEASTDLLLEADVEKTITSVSGKGLERLRVSVQDLIGKKISDVFIDSLDNHDYAYYQALLGNTYIYDWEYHLKEQVIWFESTVSPILDENKTVIGIINIARETTERKQKQIEIEFLSTHDGLTQISNRHYFVQKMETLDCPYHYPLGVFMADMNGLKLVNDVFGHQIGDEALKIIADIFKQSFRSEDVVARVGGDEFAVILTNTTYERMLSRKTLIQSRISDASVENVPLSIAIGFHLKTSLDQPMDEIVKSAEAAMYEDKRQISRVYHHKLIVTFKKNLYHQYPQEQIHAEKTFEYCKRLIECCDLSPEDVRQLDLASQVHDIGKIFIPKPIYQKPDKLTMAEYKVVQSHANQSYQMLKNAQTYEFVADIVFHHHERWDGHGYPRGLKGSEIPLLSRILAIADAMAAMTRDRPYHKKIKEKQAINELKLGSGTAYDPQIVAKFSESCNKK